MEEKLWFVGIYNESNLSASKVFYTTTSFVNARRMFLLLVDLGYERAMTNAHWFTPE